jgi:hypothetical protein
MRSVAGKSVKRILVNALGQVGESSAEESLLYSVGQKRDNTHVKPLGLCGLHASYWCSNMPASIETYLFAPF